MKKSGCVAHNNHITAAINAVIHIAFWMTSGLYSSRIGPSSNHKGTTTKLYQIKETKGLSLLIAINIQSIAMANQIIKQITVGWYQSWLA